MSVEVLRVADMNKDGIFTQVDWLISFSRLRFVTHSGCIKSFLKWKKSEMIPFKAISWHSPGNCRSYFSLKSLSNCEVLTEGTLYLFSLTNIIREMISMKMRLSDHVARI